MLVDPEHFKGGYDSDVSKISGKMSSPSALPNTSHG